MRRLWIALFVPFLLAPAFGEDELPPEPKPKVEAPAPKPGEIVATALRKLAAREEVVARVSVSEDKPQAENGNVIIMVNGGRGARQPFQGDALVWRGADGVTIVQSLAELPGFSLYISGETSVSRTTQRTTPLDVGRLRDQLAPLVDMDRLLRHVGAVKEWNVRVGGDSRTYSAELPKDTVDPSTSQSPMTARVLKVRGTFRVGKDGSLAGLEIRVTHNDPRREMLGGRVNIVVGPNGRPQVQPAKGGGKHDIEGATAIYKFRFPARARPPARAQRFKAEMAQALENAEPEKDE